MSNFIYTDEDQQKTVEENRNYYIGGSEIQKIMDDFFNGDIIQNLFDKICYQKKKDGAFEPEWATFGHAAEDIIREYMNAFYNKNYRPACKIKSELRLRCNTDGYDEILKELFECKTYSGKLKKDKYLKQIWTYMYVYDVDICTLVCLSKDVLDSKGKKIRNISLDELTEKELKKRLTIIEITKDNKYEKFIEHLEPVMEEYISLYDYITNSKFMKQYLEQYSLAISKQDSFIAGFMEGII